MIQTPGNFSAQAQFLKLARNGAGFICFKPIDGMFFAKHFTDVVEALKLIELHGVHADTWVSMATYSKSSESRSQENAEYLCALWLDLDAHGGNKYQSVEDVKVAIERFVHETGLPEPSLIHLTGYGVHAIWTFTEVIPKSQWQPVADKFHVGADPILTTCAD